MGNTCYANAVLQCLMSTALTQALTDKKAAAIFRRYSSNPNILAQGSGSVDSQDPSRYRKRRESWDRTMQENCSWLSRELKTLAIKYHEEPKNPDPSPTFSDWLTGTTSAEVVDPGAITKNPHRLSSCLTPYQQEDAHEFMRALLGTLVMHGQNRQLSSLFDGLLESAVTCLTCGRPSLTRDRYMDLSLDIVSPDVRCLSDALYEFTCTETLCNDNEVYYQRCEHKSVATKGLRLATAPSILVCHFKRFAFDEHGRLSRLNKKVEFPLRLEIGEYMSQLNKARPPPYELVAVLVHQGTTCDSGHYLAYVKNDGDWYKCNDSQVSKVDLTTVLSQQAYILMYEVAEMRDNHGYPSPNKCSRSKHEPTTRSSDFMSMMCGVDREFFRDVCCSVFHPPPSPVPTTYDSSRGGYHTPETPADRRRASETIPDSRRSHRTPDTLDDATVVTTASQRMRRSSSSGWLTKLDAPPMPELETSEAWSGMHPLPPRQRKHRRANSAAPSARRSSSVRY